MTIVQVEYNGKKIINLPSERQAEIVCYDKRAVNTFVITASSKMKSDMHLIYNGVDIAILKAGQRLTLECQENRMNDNLILLPGGIIMSNFILSNGDSFMTKDNEYFNAYEP